MITTRIRFINPMGFHSRPCAMFTKMAKKFDCQVKLSHAEKSADARSMLALMKLGIVHGNTITLQCEGAQEQEASDILTHFLATLVEVEG